MFSNYLELIQHHKILYILVVGIILGVINTIVFFIQKKADKYQEISTSHSAKRNHIIITLVICVLAAIIPLIISTYYPYIEPTSAVNGSNYNDTTSKPIGTTSKPIGTTSKPIDITSKPIDTTSKPIDITSKPIDTTSKPIDTTSKPIDTTSKPIGTTSKPIDTTSIPTHPNTNINYNGYLKLSFFNGRFSYRTPGALIYNENDVIGVSDRSYFSDSITPIVYITIIDDSDEVVYDGKSEHLNSCLIKINYGTYTLIASCDNYKRYTTTITLTPENKTTDVWQHDIFFIPDEYVATDLKIQVVDKDGFLLTNCEVSIGYTGFTLTETVDETGIISELFTLAKGEYLVYIDSLDLHGRFYVNESIGNESLIVVKLE